MPDKPQVRQVVSALDKVPTMDLAKTLPEIAEGNAGKIRSTMPQVDDLEAFATWLGTKGKKVAQKSVSAGSLFPTQKHFKTEKVKGMVAAIGRKEAGMSKPLLVAGSSIIDGHHRWAAHRMLSPSSQVAVYAVSASPDEVIKMAKEYGARSEKLASAFEAAMGTANSTNQDEPERNENGSDRLDIKGGPSPTGKNGLVTWFEEKTKTRADKAKESERLYGSETVGVNDT